MLNKVIIMGRITKELEVRQTTSGTAVLRFTVAVDRFVKNGENTADFINCVAWGATAENINRFFGKGKLIAIEGNIKTGSFEGKDGKMIYNTDVYVDRFSFTGEKSERGSSGSGQQSQGEYQADYEDIISDVEVPF